jgi:hypothetical protein
MVAPPPWEMPGAVSADPRLLPLLNNDAFISQRDPNTSHVVQVGANDHNERRSRARSSSRHRDTAVLSVKAGWRALLLEPTPHAFARLAKRYVGEAPRVRTLHAAVCTTGRGDGTASRPKSKAGGGKGDAGGTGDVLWGSSARVHTCNRDGPTSTRSASMWVVDETNATGNWGSNFSDTRCITALRNVSDSYKWVLELSSFSKHHPLKHQNNLLGYSSKNCRLCSRTLYDGSRRLPPSCLSRVITDNLRERSVSCACLPRELQGWNSVELLAVDAEGHDDDVLGYYPFDRWPPTRIVFEPKHIGRARFEVLASRLRHLGYECLEVLRARYLNATGAGPAVVRTSAAAVSPTCHPRGGSSTWQRVLDGPTRL